MIYIAIKYIFVFWSRLCEFYNMFMFPQSIQQDGYSILNFNSNGLKKTLLFDDESLNLISAYLINNLTNERHDITDDINKLVITNKINLTQLCVFLGYKGTFTLNITTDNVESFYYDMDSILF